MSVGVNRLGRSGGVGNGPSVCDYDVVEGCVTLAEAGEADLDHHGLIYKVGAWKVVLLCRCMNA